MTLAGSLWSSVEKLVKERNRNAVCLAYKVKVLLLHAIILIKDGSGHERTHHKFLKWKKFKG